MSSTVLNRPALAAMPAAPRRPHRRYTWLGRAVPLLAVAAVVAVQAYNITGWPAVSNDDEGTYLAQAWAIQHGHGLAHYTYWYDHPPFGWIQIAMMSWAVAPFASASHTLAASLRVVIVPVTAASCVLLYVLARRLGLPRWSGVLGVLLFGLSPLSVNLQREVLLDNFAVMWILAAMVLCTSPRRDLWQHTAAGVAAAGSLLSKETMAVVLPAVALLLWQNTHRSTRKFSVVGAVSGFSLTLAVYPLFALLKNELFPGPRHVSLLGGLLWQIHRKGSGGLLAPGSGTQKIVGYWLGVDRVLIIGGVLAAVLLLARRPLRPIALAVALLVLTLVRNGYVPGMYVIQALPFLALALAGAAERGVVLVRWAWARVGRALPAARRWPLDWAVVALAGVLAAGFVVPRWYSFDRTAVTADANAGFDQATQWLGAHLKNESQVRMAVDDVVWLDLVVRDGLQPGLGAIWFYKIDLDPAIKETLPHGWQDLDYIVSTPSMRGASGLPLTIVHAALQHSNVVASFGSGDDRIEIRKVAGFHAGDSVFHAPDRL